MKKLLSSYLIFLNIIPMLAAPRDDRDSGTSGITLIIVIILFIIGAINSKEDKRK